MDGTSTLDEEDILAQYFKGDNIPEEWACYKEMFQEIEAMKPEAEAELPVVTAESTRGRRRWMIWSVAAAAAVAGLIYLAAPGNKAYFQPSAPLTAQADTTAVQQSVEPVIQSQPETVGTDSLTAPKAAVKPAKATKRSKRKVVPTIHDVDKAYTLMAQAKAEAEVEAIEAQLAAYGYVPVMQEDGTIVYINEQTNFIAYEE
jgi:Tfp pilus assembly protein PilE